MGKAIIIKYEKARQTVDLKTQYNKIGDYIKDDIELVDTRDGCYCEEGEFVVDELLSGIYENREAQRQIKEMLKMPFDVLIVVEKNVPCVNV